MEELPIEQVKTSTAKNDTPNKFWASVEPYCAPFTDDDLKVNQSNLSLITLSHHNLNLIVC